MENQNIIQVDEKVPLGKMIPLSIQHMFAMFGASVLVPMLFHINPAVVLLMNGLGTLLFILLTKGKAPAYLGSSFAFLSPALLIIDSVGYPYALGGFVIVGLTICLVAGIIYLCGVKWIDVVLPPAAMGPVVALIGLELAGNAAQGANIVVSDSNPVIHSSNVIVFMVTIGVAVLGNVLFRKFFAVIPILIAIVSGYVAAFITGLVTWDQISAAVHVAFFSLPDFQAPKFELKQIVILLPAVLVIVSEHIGHQLVTSKIVGRDLIKDPGLHRSMLADGISTALSGLVGAVPTTTYGENIGVMAITKVYSVRVIAGAAILSILCAFVGPVSALINTIPWAVIGGISFLLYGMIATSGIRILVDNKVDYSRSRNMVLTSVVFITGLSGVSVNLNEVQIKGMVLACIVGIILSLLFYIFDLLKITNDLNQE